MNGGLDSLKRDYAFLDECPERFFDIAITWPFGDLRGRVRGICAWRDALLNGRLPPADAWPPAKIAAPVRLALDEMKITRFCKDCPELVDDLLEDILKAFSRQDKVFQEDIAKRLRELEEFERAKASKRKDIESKRFRLSNEVRRRLRDQAEREVSARARVADPPKFKLCKGGTSSARARVAVWPPATATAGRPHSARARVQEDIAKRLRELEELERAKASKRKDIESKRFRLSNKVRRRLRDQAEREVSARARVADPGLLEAWEERARIWAEIASVFGDLGEMLGRGWDLTLGVLRHTGWNELLRLRELVKRIPEFRDIVQALGRLHVSETAQTVAEQVFVPMRRLDTEWLEIPTPLVPEETRGIERSGEIARMLPVEAAMLGHPKLRLLWHARRSEQALLTYRVEGVELEKKIVEKETTKKADARRPRRERGPILAIVDTSGSMNGLPEQVAKALVLEALRTAYAEKRRCCLYIFSGPNQFMEHELDLSPEGIGKLLEFLGLTFGGGSDPTGVMAGVLGKIKENEWTKADVLFVSDGEWPAPSALVEAVRKERKAGTRFHGVQVGNRGQTGLHDLCEPVHVFSSWIDIEGGRVN